MRCFTDIDGEVMKLSALLFACAALACTDVTTPRTSLKPASSTRQVITNERDSMPLFTIACNGEPLTGEMFSHDILMFTQPANGSTVAYYSADYKLTGVGAETGANYEGTLHEREQGMESVNGANVFRTTSRLLLVSQGNIPNTLVDFTTMAVTDGNGDVVFEHTDFQSRCQ